MYDIVKTESVSNTDLSDGRYLRAKYPFRSMEVGESFLVASDERNNAAAAASYYGKRNGVKFSCRKTDSGYIVLRIK